MVVYRLQHNEEQSKTKINCDRHSKLIKSNELVYVNMKKGDRILELYGAFQFKLK